MCPRITGRMKEIRQTYISVIFLIGLWIFSYYSCSKDNCDHCRLSVADLAFIVNKKGDMSFFKNDLTGDLDTLHCESLSSGSSSCSDPCRDLTGSNYAMFKFSPTRDPWIYVSIGNPAIIRYSFGNIDFPLTMAIQSMTINNITYNDVYSVSIDSNSIDNGDKIPWKIDYSKSRGFVRFYLKNNIIWSRV